MSTKHGTGKKEKGANLPVEKRNRWKQSGAFVIQLRFTEGENTDLLIIARTLGISVAELLRTKGLGAKNQVINGVNLISSLDKIGAELGYSGNNINQLARHANAINKMGKVDQAVMNRFNVLFSDYITTGREIQVALRRIIREVRG